MKDSMNNGREHKTVQYDDVPSFDMQVASEIELLRMSGKFDSDVIARRRLHK